MLPVSVEGALVFWAFGARGLFFASWSQIKSGSCFSGKRLS